MNNEKNFNLKFIRDKILPGLTKVNKDLALDEFSRPLNTYIDRISRIGLVKHSNGLDAGCGLGNWTIPLAMLNSNITGIDFDSNKIKAAKKIAENMSFNNIKFVEGDLTDLPFEDNEFDFIICYSVIMYTNPEKVLKEFRRVLSTNGKLYIMTDLWRWLLIPPNKRLFDLFVYWFNILILRLKGTKYKFFTKRSFENMLERKGFLIVSKGQDAESSFISKNVKSNIEGFYPKVKDGYEYLWEVCAFKK